ncbi:MAG: anaerobic glycerol-3-phosphate dehydrogenase subunit B, partial [Desulfovibrionaceae bacterium]|nr:anaerobic glycerol-3-phosphate dehydrogenase subunit B [Desulfovibrionaceae bacterium]
MQVTSDVLVIGSGIAGLTSALAAAESGLKVTLACCGCGTYSISSGCIDLLGQLEQNYVEDPWAAMFQLPEDHPYRLIGQENIKQALQFFSQILERQGGSFKVACDEALNPKNTLLPNILGTFKPSYLIPESLDSTPLFTAQKVLICGVEGLRDMSSKLVRDNLALNSQFKNTKFIATNLPNPEASSRSLTALDLARLVNTQAGWEWLSTSLGKYAQSFDCVLLPPICGTSKHHQVLKDLKALLGFPVEELLTIPPGVGGLRLHELLLKEARPLKIRFLENTQICQSLVETNHCLKVATAETQNLEITAKAYVLATGGILGGGLNLTPT